MSKFNFFYNNLGTNNSSKKRTIIVVLATVALFLQISIEFDIWPVNSAVHSTSFGDLTANVYTQNNGGASQQNPSPNTDPSALISTKQEPNSEESPSKDGDNKDIKSVQSGEQKSNDNISSADGNLASSNEASLSSSVQKTQKSPTPGKVTPTPGKVTPTPGKVSPTPGKVSPIPGKVQGIPGKMKGKPGKVSPVPGKMKGIPGKVKGIPGKMEGIPGKMEGKPGKATSFDRSMPPQEIILGLKRLNDPSCKTPLTEEQCKKLIDLLKELGKAYGDVRNSTNTLCQTITPEQFAWLENHPDNTHDDSNMPPEQAAYEPALSALKAIDNKTSETKASSSNTKS